MSGHGEDDVKIGLATLWAIGVGSALGGDFFGWQFVLYGGFASALTAVIFSGVFYWLYAGAITELAARYRTSGGAFDFVKCALGRRSAALMAVLGLLKLLLANSALALAISSYLVSAGMPSGLQLFCWIGTYGFFTYLDSVGVRQSANAQVLATILCVLILIFYSASTLSKFSVSSLRADGYFEDGGLGFFKGLPFALQFYDGFEEVPLLMGYAHDPERTIPRAILICYITVAMIAFMVLICGAGSTPTEQLLNSEAPLMDGIDLVYGPGNFFSDSIAYLIVLGLVVNFFAFVLFTSQQVQAVAEAGQFPAILAYRHPVHGAPIYASIASSVVGIILTAGFSLVFGESAAQNTLVTAALMPAVLGYGLLLECIIRVREIEHKQFTEKISPRDAMRLGYDPGPLRFKYGSLGARGAQLMCLVFAVALVVLATVSADFMYGLLVLGFCSAVLYSGMYYFISNEMKSEEPINHVHQLISSDDTIDDVSDNPIRIQSTLQYGSAGKTVSGGMGSKQAAKPIPVLQSAVDDDTETELPSFGATKGTSSKK